MRKKNKQRLVLLTGVSGYVGGRLLKALESNGERLRCLCRNPDFVTDRTGDKTELVQGDVLKKDSLLSALNGVDSAYYLVHCMGSQGSFVEQDRLAAQNFIEAAEEAGVRRIIYLGGLGAEEELSSHLASRQEVGRILSSSKVQAIEFRASIIIGSGSLSFEMIRSLVNKLPVMITPRWVRTRAQPIAIEDVITYLVSSLDLEIKESRVFEIGGPDQVAYAELLREYAHQIGVKRYIIPVPVLTPWLSSLWLGLVTPVYARVGRKMIDSLRHETLVKDGSAAEFFTVRPLGISQAIERALHNEDREFAETRWSDAISSSGVQKSWGGMRFGPRIADVREGKVRATAEQAFKPILQIGGKQGWYYANWAWKLRGFLDLLAGGVGFRRGRPSQQELTAGDTIDFWRVEAFQPNSLLRLFAEMKLPGRAWLQFEVMQDKDICTITQTALFDPLGVLGRVYWYALYPIHCFIFAGMLRNLLRRVEKERKNSASS